MSVLNIKFLMVVVFFVIQPAHASETGTDHYTAGEIASVRDAVRTLGTSGDAIAAVLEKENLGVQELEQIHEISYTIEAAVKKLRESGKFETGKLDTLASTVEEIHLASEYHLEEIVRKYFKDYATDVSAVLETEKATH